MGFETSLVAEEETDTPSVELDKGVSVGIAGDLLRSLHSGLNFQGYKQHDGPWRVKLFSCLCLSTCQKASNSLKSVFLPSWAPGFCKTLGGSDRLSQVSSSPPSCAEGILQLSNLSGRNEERK